MKEIKQNTKSSIADKERYIASKLGSGRNRVFDRFPLLFTMLASFGLVATLYGFERVIDEIDLFADNPYILLGTGIIILVGTGSLYKVLGERQR